MRAFKLVTVTDESRTVTYTHASGHSLEAVTVFFFFCSQSPDQKILARILARQRNFGDGGKVSRNILKSFIIKLGQEAKSRRLSLRCGHTLSLSRYRLLW